VASFEKLKQPFIDEVMNIDFSRYLDQAQRSTYSELNTSMLNKPVHTSTGTAPDSAVGEVLAVDSVLGLGLVLMRLDALHSDK